MIPADRGCQGVNQKNVENQDMFMHGHVLIFLKEDMEKGRGTFCLPEYSVSEIFHIFTFYRTWI